jgi:molybdenum cofactor cytidylyltransferase
MPRVPVAVLAPLAERLAAGALCAAPIFQGSRGHPTVFAAALFPDLLALTGDEGARKVLERIGPALVEAPDAGVLFDVDAPGDLEPGSPLSGG